MIVVVNTEVEVDALDRALRQGGFTLRSKPGGIFELRQVAKNRPLCDKCDEPADVRQGEFVFCAEHYHHGD